MVSATLDDFLRSETRKRGLYDLIGRIVYDFKAIYVYVKTAFNYGILASAGFLSYAASGAAGPVTAGAMMLGKVLLNFKKRAKTEWSKLYREGWKGLILGNLAKLFYQNVINKIPNQNSYGKIGRALAYNPGFIGGIYNPIYLKATNILDGKRSQKGEWWNLTKRIFKYNSVPHFVTTNYISNVQQQVAASAFLGTAYRVLAG